jgi:uncharacterized protein (DUF2141 family)
MKPILIDTIQDEFAADTGEFTVEVDGKKLKGWQIAKPMNYDPEYFTMEERQKMADEILKGKAIAVRFFEDLTPEEQAEYVRNEINKSAKLENDDRTLTND